MLRTDLPEIITETLPGPKAQKMIDRRNAVVPGAIRCGYPVVIERGEGAMKMWMEINSLTGSAVSVY